MSSLISFISILWFSDTDHVHILLSLHQHTSFSLEQLFVDIISLISMFVVSI